MCIASLLAINFISCNNSSHKSVIKIDKISFEERVHNLFTNYFKSPNCLDRLNYISNPEKNYDYLKEHYKNVNCDRLFFSISKIDCVATKCYVLIDRNWYCINKFPLKIDWLCSTGFNTVTFSAFKATYQKNKPITSRVYGELCNYFNYEFRNLESKLYCIRMKENNKYETIYGYVVRDSELGKHIFNTLKDGESHAMVMELMYLNNSQDKDQVVIKSGKFGWNSD